MLLAAAMLAVALTGTAQRGPQLDAPGDALTLDVAPVVGSPIGVPAAGAAAPTPRGGGPTSTFPVGIGMAMVGIAAAATVRRRKKPIFVVVHGYGGSPGDFDRLLTLMGVDGDDVVAFDYRSAAQTPYATSTEASRSVSTHDAAGALDRLIRDLAAKGRPVYSIHHSKGGAVGVEMIAALDDGRQNKIDGYRGAALLDPAIAGGTLGRLQRVGSIAQLVPDNGGFDPRQCLPDIGCRDVRAHLGERSGVEVIAIRNPDAVVTNFIDEPGGLRVYDLDDDGLASAVAPFRTPFGALERVSEAHGSVVWHWAVADCIAAEAAAPGSCEWKGSSGGRRPLWGSANARNKMR